MTEPTELLPCPFCGGPVKLEETVSCYNKMHGHHQWWGVVCRSCAIQQRPSASKDAAIDRWNRRTAPSTEGESNE